MYAPWELEEVMGSNEAEAEARGSMKSDSPPVLRKPPSVDNIRTISVSRKSILAEIAKNMSALEPTYETWMSYGGYRCKVRLLMADAQISGKLNEEFASSCGEHITAEKAEEKAAEWMIRKLERKYSFETDDLNWCDKHMYDLDRYNAYDRWHRVKEENQDLKRKVELLTEGWRSTLGRAEFSQESAARVRRTTFDLYNPQEPGASSWISLSNAVDAEEGASMVVNEGIADFEEIAGRY